MLDKPQTPQDILQKITGLSKEEQQKIFEEVRNNSEKLKNCSRHNFVEITSFNDLNHKYMCTNCGGKVDYSGYRFYEQGFRHGQEVKANGNS